MGSRAVVLVCRDGGGAAGALRRSDGARGASTPAPGGRSSTPALTEASCSTGCARRSTAAGLLDELDTDWLLLDAELLPWSAKAEDCSAASTPRSARPPGRPCRAAAEALDGSPAPWRRRRRLLARTARRAARRRRASPTAYRRYCWPVDGLDGVASRRSRCSRARDDVPRPTDHAWHLARRRPARRGRPGAARRDPAPGRRPRRRRSRAPPAIALVGGADRRGRRGHGGEAARRPRAPGRRASLQPGDQGAAAASTCGSSTAPSTPSRPTSTGCATRGLGHKRSLALREYALGLEALERFARGEPLWRVHECVFAVLALESSRSTRGSDGRERSCGVVRPGPSSSPSQGCCAFLECLRNERARKYVATHSATTTPSATQPGLTSSSVKACSAVTKEAIAYTFIPPESSRSPAVTLRARTSPGRPDDQGEGPRQVRLVAEPELDGQRSPVGVRAGVRGRSGVEQAEPLDDPFGPDAEVGRELPLQRPQADPGQLRQLLGANQRAVLLRRVDQRIDDVGVRIGDRVEHVRYASSAAIISSSVCRPAGSRPQQPSRPLRRHHRSARSGP